jgi:hypothetical protein
MLSHSFNEHPHLVKANSGFEAAPVREVKPIHDSIAMDGPESKMSDRVPEVVHYSSTVSGDGFVLVVLPTRRIESGETPSR